MIAADVPAGTLASREYSHPLSEGRAASIIITLVCNGTELPSAEGGSVGERRSGARSIKLRSYEQSGHTF